MRESERETRNEINIKRVTGKAETNVPRVSVCLDRVQHVTQTTLGLSSKRFEGGGRSSHCRRVQGTHDDCCLATKKDLCNFMDVSVSVCLCVCVSVSVCVSVCVCVCLSVSVCIYVCNVCNVSMYVCMYVL